MSGRLFVITDLSIDGVTPTYADPHPERTPVGPFESREDAWDYARQMQTRYGTGGGSVDVSPLEAPRTFDADRTEADARARLAADDQRLAQELRARGWTVSPPTA